MGTRLRATAAASSLVLWACGSAGEAGPASSAHASSAASVALSAAAPSAEPAASIDGKKALREGRRLAKEGKWSEAQKALRAASEADPDDVALLSELGWAALNAGDEVASVEASEHALGIATEPRVRAQVLYNLGRALEARGDKDAAKKRYDESLSLRPNRTVEARLESLGGARKRAQPAPQKTTCDRTFPNTQALCDCLLAHKSSLALFVDESKLVCDIDRTSPSSPSGELQVLRWGAAEAGTGEAVVILTANTGGGVRQVAELGRDYDPGAFGVHNEAKVASIDEKKVDDRSVAIVKTEQRDSDANAGGLERYATRTLKATVCVLRDAQHETTCPVALPLEIDESLHYATDLGGAPADVRAFVEEHRKDAYDRSARFELSLVDGKATLKQTKGSEALAPSAAVGPHPLW